jgi:hypothetical protein
MINAWFQQPSQALVELEEATSLAREVGNLARVAECLRRLSGLYVKVDIQKAISAGKESVELYDQLGNDLAGAISRWQLSHLVPDKDAVHLLTKAIPMFDNSSFTFHSAESRLDLAETYFRLGQFPAAIAILQGPAYLRSLEYRSDLVFRAQMLLTECLLLTGQSGPLIGAIGGVLDTDERNECKFLCEKMRDTLQDLQTILRNNGQLLVHGYGDGMSQLAIEVVEEKASCSDF